MFNAIHFDSVYHSITTIILQIITRHYFLKIVIYSFTYLINVFQHFAIIDEYMT